METRGRQLYQVHDFHLVDANDQSVGTVDWIWPDDGRGGEEFLGVHLQWLRGRARAVPAQGARIDVQARTIRVAYPRARIATAPRFAIDRALGASDQEAVLAHYARGTVSAASRQPLALSA